MYLSFFFNPTDFQVWSLGHVPEVLEVVIMIAYVFFIAV
jgi:hypothetical protein